MSSLPLPMFPPRGGDPWRLPHPAPTTLLALWPGSRPPLQELAAEALLQHAPECVLVGEMSSPPEGTLWTLIADLPAPIDSRVVIFAEPADPAGAVDLDDACKACRWIVGVELLLPRERLLRSFVAAMRIAHAVAPDTPAILDVASSTWHGADSLDRWFVPSDADPPEWMLWTAHAVCRDREYRAGHPAWIRTSGLWRCGIPELEIVDMPAELVQSGVTLVHAVAELLLDEPMPAPCERWNIGMDIDVALVPWQEVVPLLPEESPASLAARRLGDGALRTPDLSHPFGGVRAVICNPDPRGSYRKLWSWPEHALKRLAAGEALLHQSASAGRRAHRLAQRTLPQLFDAVRLLTTTRGASALTSAAPGDPRVLVAAAFDPEAATFVSRDRSNRSAQKRSVDEEPLHAESDPAAPGEPVEHLWMSLEQLDAGELRGTLLNSSATCPSVRAGAAATIDQQAVTDWQVFGGGIVLTPDEAEWLPGAMRRWLGVEEPDEP